MSVDPNRPSESSEQFPQWGSEAVTRLFQAAADLQKETGVFDTWKDWNLGDLGPLQGRFMPAPNLAQIMRGIHSDLPLVVTKLPIDHGRNHEDYLLGLAKIDPQTGETIPSTWAYAAELEDGEVNSQYSPYTDEQQAAILWQLQAQEELGIVLATA